MNDNNSQDTLDQLSKQEDVYESGNKEKLCKDGERTMQRYLRQLFRMVKFLSDSDKEFKQPNFVSNRTQKKQTVTICEWLLEKIGKPEVYIFVFKDVFIIFCKCLFIVSRFCEYDRETKL